jgi:elongation factor Ts
MAEISAADVMALRERTGLPMMQCKKALIAAGGNPDEAIKILKQEVRGLKEKQVDRETKEGRIFIKIAEGGKAGAMVEVLCESAPVAGGEDFVRFGEALAASLLETSAATPDVLLVQKGKSGTLADDLDEIINRIREKIVVNRVVRMDGPVAGYVHHDGKVGVLFQATGEKGSAPVLRDVAMHIAALKPTVVNPEELDAATVKEERDRLSEEARASGKPANVIDKIVDGRMKVFYQGEGVLNLQNLAQDESKSVSQALAEHGLKAKSFIRWKIG